MREKWKKLPRYPNPYWVKKRATQRMDYMGYTIYCYGWSHYGIFTGERVWAEKNVAAQT